MPFLRDWHAECYRATGLKEHRIGESLGLCNPKGGQGGWVDWASVQKAPQEIIQGRVPRLLVGGHERQSWLIALKPSTGESLGKSGTKHVLSYCGRARSNEDNLCLPRRLLCCMRIIRLGPNPDESETLAEGTALGSPSVLMEESSPPANAVARLAPPSGSRQSTTSNMVAAPDGSCRPQRHQLDRTGPVGVCTE